MAYSPKKLQLDHWFTRMPNGRLRMKRVSIEREAQFPRAYRELLRARGWVGLTNQIMVETGCTLAQAWARVKTMVNE